MSGIENYKACYFKDLYKLYCSCHLFSQNSKNAKNISDILDFEEDVKAKLLIINNKVRGYIFFTYPNSKFDRDTVCIYEVFIEKRYNTYNNYLQLVESINKSFLFKKYKNAYFLLDDRFTKPVDIVGILDLKLDRRLIEMKVWLDAGRRAFQSENVKFSFFKKGIDEEKRAALQNSIFKETKWHRDCTVSDVLNEEQQDYYLEDGSIFLNYNGQAAGYSQIIVERHPFVRPCIVNFGISKEYRGLGLSKCLLNYTLDLVKQKGYKEAYINVDYTNYKAFNLYKKTGFIKTNSYSLYKYVFR